MRPRSRSASRTMGFGEAASSVEEGKTHLAEKFPHMGAPIRTTLV